MELNTQNLLYMFQSIPYFVVLYFCFQSIFNQDFKGLIYLAGLFLSIFAVVNIGNISFIKNLVSLNKNSNSKNVQASLCPSFDILNTGITSFLPLGDNILAYTFFYILYIILKYKIIGLNIGTIILFTILIISNLFINLTYKCNDMVASVISIVIGGMFGLFWAFVIDKTAKVDLQLFSGISNKVVCSRPSRTVYRCRVKNKQ